ncbi:MAG: hypothetical protein ACTSO9_03015 [Candidatus Helarchaeota archaeon]
MSENPNTNLNSIPILCVGMVFEQGAVPISTFGFEDEIDTCLLAGFTHAIESFTSYLSTALPNVIFEKDSKILDNFLNTGFHLSQFKNKNDHKNYVLIFRPIANNLFSKYWINKLLLKFCKLLEETDDIGKKSKNIFITFNWILFKELQHIQHVFNKKLKGDSNQNFIFRESGVRTGAINNPKIEKIFDFIVNNMEISPDIRLQINGHIYTIEKEEYDSIDYFKLKIKSKERYEKK